MRIGYEDPDTLITYPRAHNLSACAQPIRMRCTRPTGAPGVGTRALAVKTQPLRVAAMAMERFPNNVACNSPEIASNIEFTSLELQRLWAVPFIRAAELHATFGESAAVVPGARPPNARAEPTRDRTPRFRKSASTGGAP